MCDNPSCKVKDCHLRHPKKCKFYGEYNYCKFGNYCKFVHEANEDQQEIKEIKEKLKEVEKELLEKENKIKIIDEEIDRFQQSK